MRRTLYLQFFAGEAGSLAAEATAAENGTAAPAGENTAQPSPSAGADTDARFEELIKGEFADAFQKRTQKIINARFKKTKELEASEKELSTLRQTLEDILPDTAGKSAADAGELLRQALSTPAQPESAASEPAAQTPGRQEASEEKNLFASLKDTLLVRQKKAQAQKILDGWTKEAEEMKATYPDFELKTALSQNADFAALVKTGLPLRKAYEAANLEQILSSAMRYAALRGGQKTADSMRQSGARVQENSVLDRASSLKTTDVNSLTQKDILRIIGEVNRGAKITFK